MNSKVGVRSSALLASEPNRSSGRQAQSGLPRGSERRLCGLSSQHFTRPQNALLQPAEPNAPLNLKG
jgi:hypothetical protein